MDAMGIVPDFHGVLCHNHWKPYFRYGRVHALCKAHCLREFERDGQQWARRLRVFAYAGQPSGPRDSPGCGIETCCVRGG